MNNKLKFLAGMSTAFLMHAAHAEIYICKDASGRTLTSDRPIPECAERKVRVLGKNGLTAREIAAPLTEEQKRQQQIEQDKRKQAQAAAEEQKRQDRALLARFSKEADIELARRRTLDQINEHIKREEVSISISEKRLKDARAEAAAQAKGKAVPAPIQRKIDDSVQSIAASKQQISDYQADVAKTNAKYDLTLKRFRELNGAATAKAEIK
jgi:hypothetical protein